MVFDRLAKMVTKRYKLIVAIWAIALILSAPAMLMLNDVVSYDTDMSSAGESESTRATEIIENEFQSSVSNGTLIIVLQSDDMTSGEARDYVLELQQRIEDADIEYLEDVSSIYSYSEQVMYLTITELGPQIHTAEGMVNQTAFLLWGVPAIYVQNWAGHYALDANETNATNYAYLATDALLEAYLEGSDESASAMTKGYFNAFASAWNSTAHLSATLTPAARAEQCVNTVGPNFIGGLPLDESEAALMSSALNYFDLDTFSDPVQIHMFTLNAIGSMAGIGDMEFLQEVYDLGPEYEASEVNRLATSIVENQTLDGYPVTLPDALLNGFISPSGSTMLIVLSFRIDSTFSLDDGTFPMLQAVDGVRDIVGDVTGDSGYEVDTYVTGMAAISSDMKESSMNDMMLIEPITIVVILVLMGYLFRTVVGQFLPLGAVGVAVGISQALIYVLACTVMDVNYMISTILFSLLMGVGTDYSIFIVTRYREERIKGASREEAVHTSIVWAGESVATSASTVIIAFLAMATADFSLVQSMGLILSGAILIALLVALTLVPSIIMLVGNRIFWPTTGKRWTTYVEKVMKRRNDGHHNYFHRAAKFSVDHAKVIVVIAIVVTLPTAYLYVTADTSFDFIGVMGDSESIEGMKAMTEDFGAGAIEPTQIVMVSGSVIYDGATFDYEYLDAVENITAAIASEPMVEKVTSITRPYGGTIDYRNLSAMSDTEQEQALSGMLSFLGDDGASLLFTVVLNEEPQSSEAVDFIPELRGMLAEEMDLQSALDGSEILVGGTTAALYDTSESTSSEFTMIEGLVVIGIFIVLMFVLGSVLLPLFAVISIAMSITWAFALTNLVFGTWLGLPVLWLIPLILFVMLMGIGMDYNVFILTRIREEIHKGKDTKEAVITAVDWTGGIITALALIMVGAFGAMMLSSNAMLQEFGFALSVAVLLDAMIVRTYIVPAALTLMGKKAWWAPGRLQREGRQEKRARADNKDR